ncbi:FtsB family cell division protein [Viscerimonas tarda]
MDSFKKLVKILFGKFSKVQLIVLAVIILFGFIISDSSIFARIEYNAEISNLKKQIEYYQNKTEEDKRKLNELRSNKENIEKFARENYLMKKENEEIFIIK